MKQTFSCPVELALEILGGKWRAVILAHIKEGCLRYADLRRKIPGMSEKMLTQRLRELVDTGLVTSSAGTYQLTERGDSVRPVLGALHALGESLAPGLGVRIEQPLPRRSRA